MVSRSVSRSVSRHVATTASEQPWLPPDTPKHFDFINDRYSTNGDPARLNDISEFSRLTSATMWVDGQLVSVDVDVPRLSGEGLLIEPMRTNLIIQPIDQMANIRTSVQHAEGDTYKIIAEGDGGAYIGSLYNTAIMRDTPYDYASSVEVRAGTYHHIRLSRSSSANASGIMVDLTSGEVETEGSLNTNYKKINKDWGRVSVGRLNNTYPLTSFALYLTDYIGAKDSGWEDEGNFPTADEYIYARRPQLEKGGDSPTSYIPTSGTPATRAKETLVVPFTTGQTVTADKDAGVTMTIVDNNAVFEGHGYIRNVRVN